MRVSRRDTWRTRMPVHSLAMRRATGRKPLIHCVYARNTRPSRRTSSSSSAPGWAVPLTLTYWVHIHLIETAAPLYVPGSITTDEVEECHDSHWSLGSR